MRERDPRESFTSEEQSRRFAADPGILVTGERWWKRHRDFLKDHGYTLRSRYADDWEPSWKAKGLFYDEVEDGQIPSSPLIMDAIRISDGLPVVLKKIRPTAQEQEIEILHFMNTEPLRSDPRNNVMPLLDVLDVPATERDDAVRLIVTPLLRSWDDPWFETFGEVVAFFTQMFNGIQILHEQRIAHRDCTYNNIMMDATSMYPKPFHPVEQGMRLDWKGRASHYSRTKRPPRYYWIDFGHSLRYDKVPVLQLPRAGGDHSVPEHQNDKYYVPSDPFATDIYYLGNLIRLYFIRGCHGFEFMESLVHDMVQEDPAQRPKIDEVVSRFREIRASLGFWKLCTRVIPRNEWTIIRILRMFTFPAYVVHFMSRVITRKSAIPDP